MNNRFSNEDRWSIIILRSELAQLQREQEHLRLKNLERTLTPWERLRLAECMDEMMELLSRFSKNRMSAMDPSVIDIEADDESIVMSTKGAVSATGHP